MAVVAMMKMTDLGVWIPPSCGNHARAKRFTGEANEREVFLAACLNILLQLRSKSKASLAF